MAGALKNDEGPSSARGRIRPYLTEYPGPRDRNPPVNYVVYFEIVDVPSSKREHGGGWLICRHGPDRRYLRLTRCPELVRPSRSADRHLDREEIGRVALNDIAAVIVHAHGVTWTTSLVVKLAERGAMMVLCAANHAPCGHDGSGGRPSCPERKVPRTMCATLPFRKRAWQSVVQAKIRNQGSCSSRWGESEGRRCCSWRSG